MIKFLLKVMGLGNGKGLEAQSLHERILKTKDKDIKQLRKVNKSIKLLLDEGNIEIVIRNVRGVLEEK